MTDRLPEGGLIDRTRRLGFRFDGRRLQGCQGDTLASALLANGVQLVGRSFKYHRPRSIYSAGVEEPNALVTLGRGARREPNCRATTVELFDGLEAQSQNRWPGLGFDLSAAAGLLAPLLPAGFYYKTFFGGPGWRFFEPFIRRAAGLGRAGTGPDPNRYDQRHIHCEVLVIGGGPAGLAAARAAAERGARVVLAEQDCRFGGSLLWSRRRIDGRDGPAWAEAQVQALIARPDVTLLRRTTAFGYYDGNLVALVERRADHLAEPPAFTARQRLWWVRAGRVVLATGAIEQPLLFPDNDRPGAMLAGAVRAYLNRYAVRPGRRAVLYTNNDAAYATALDLQAAGAEIAGVVDTRPRADGPWQARLRAASIPLLDGHLLTGTRGRRGMHGVVATPLDGGPPRPLGCDLVAVGGGWAPAVHLHAQAGGRLRFDAGLGAYLPGEARQAHVSVGAAAGRFDLAGCLADGYAAGGAPRPAPATDGENEASRRQPPQPPVGLRGKVFVDLQDDVTADDLALADREGYRSVEHVKRYTTLGMGTEQGKTSNLAGLMLSARLRGEPVPEVGFPSYRPPFTPVTIGALAGTEIGPRFTPVRRTPLHDLHRRQDALFTPAGLWQRAQAYPRAGESLHEAYIREAAAVRDGVGLVDVSTLGKIDVQGADAAVLLDRVYANPMASLPVGRVRYGLMLRDDGLGYDDGTVARLADHHYLLTTTTAQADPVLARLERHLEIDWPDLRVQLASVTEQWAAIAVAGPRSRALLQAALRDADLSNEALPFMAFAQCLLEGIPARLFRISFSGELGYELNVPADWGEAAWESLLKAGRTHGVVAYGTEAMGALRIEKGHITHAEMDGRTTAADLGLGRMAGAARPYVGRPMRDRPALADPGRPGLVGLLPLDGRTPLRAGAQLLRQAEVRPAASRPVDSLGHVTSVTYSPALRMPVALALLAGGVDANLGQTVYAHFPLAGSVVTAKVVAPGFVDPAGERQRA